MKHNLCIGGFPVGVETCVIGVIHLRPGMIGANVARQRQCVIVVNDRKLTLCFAHIQVSFSQPRRLLLVVVSIKSQKKVARASTSSEVISTDFVPPA